MQRDHSIYSPYIRDMSDAKRFISIDLLKRQSCKRAYKDASDEMP